MRIDIEMRQLCAESGDMRYVIGFANEPTLQAILSSENADAAKSKERIDKSVYGSIVDPNIFQFLSYLIAEYSRK